jgi:hypothetical protein
VWFTKTTIPNSSQVILSMISSGYKNLFAKNLTTYPDLITYNIGYSLTLAQALSNYELVVSINTFEFMECNTIGWNFKKLNITNVGFALIY